MKYERLTPKDKKFNWTLQNHEYINKIFNRLAELEDKIQDGRMFELPCKVGDEVYIVAKQGLDIYAVEKVIVCDLWYSPTDNCLYPMTADECPLNEIFPTRAEAEKKLKELRGE